MTGWNPVEPDGVDEKPYARGVGIIEEQTVKGADEAVELIELTPAA